MITVDCAEVLPIQHELLIYVSDQIGVIPAVKHRKFVLSPIENNEKIDQVQVTASIKEYLDSIGEGRNFDVINHSENIVIKSVNGKKINKATPPVRTLRTCCGL